MRCWRSVNVLVAGIAAAGVSLGFVAADSVVTVPVSRDLGPVDLQVNGVDEVAHLRGMNVPSMFPGETTAAVLKVGNTGAAPLHYSVDAATSDIVGEGLGAALRVKVTGDSSTLSSGGFLVCSGKALSHTGTTLTNGLVGSAGTSRPLAPGDSESLCIQVRLPSSAPSRLQGAATAITFRVIGTS